VAKRPRLGGDGLLYLPAWVTVSRTRSAVNDAGDVIGDFDVDGYDPFLRRADGLLLTESFARLDLSKPRTVRAWMLANGVLDFDWLLRDYRSDYGYSGEFEFQDAAELIVSEQARIRWILGLLVHLTATLPPPAGEGVAFDSVWWPEEPPASLGYGAVTTRAYYAFDSALNQVRPGVERALAPIVLLEGATMQDGPSAFGVTPAFSIGPVIRREWSSILAPIDLQLYEALRRVSELKPAARLCRECGQSFLVLDGRRIAFCTDLERARFNQRAYRARRGRPLT
jgi:hypothetical protein